jgi:hypothetical protein
MAIRIPEDSVSTRDRATRRNDESLEGVPVHLFYSASSLGREVAWSLEVPNALFAGLDIACQR